jgi:hypothetical protein
MINRQNEYYIRVCTEIKGTIEFAEYLKIDYINKE